MENQREREYSNGLMGKFMKASGLMGKNTDLACGREVVGIRISVSGALVWPKVMESIPGSMAMFMRANSRLASNMVKDYKDLLMAINMLEAM